MKIFQQQCLESQIVARSPFNNIFFFFLQVFLFPSSLIQFDNSGRSTVLTKNVSTVNIEENGMMHSNVEKSTMFLTCSVCPLYPPSHSPAVCITLGVILKGYFNFPFDS